MLNNTISMYMYNGKIKKTAAYFKILYILQVILFSLKIQNHKLLLIEVSY